MSFQICIIRKLTFFTSHKSNQRLIASNIHRIPDHMCDCVSRLCFTMASFEHFQNRIIKKWESLFRSSLQEIKVQVSNIFNKTWWHGSPSVCNEHPKFTEFLFFTVDSPLHRMSDSASLSSNHAIVFSKST